VSRVRACCRETRHQALTAIVGNLEMTLLENNFYFNSF